MSLRQQFIDAASLEGANVRALCRHFSLSPTTGYKWLKRHRELGSGGTQDQSRRPTTSPRRVADRVERAVVALRSEHPAWGARKLHGVLKADAFKPVPARSTIHSILRRHGLIDYQRPQRDLLRFERPAPNDLWQMDFKGHFPTDEGPCHPFTCLDDHSRFSLGIFSCAHEDAVSVRPKLEALFGTYGLPKAILCDNGAPWGNPSDRCPVTQLGVWLWRLGIDVLHGRPYHPQTQGKLERFHRSFKAEVLTRPAWKSHDQCQGAFDHWRSIYNHRRPHESLDDEVPAKHYRASGRTMPAALPPVDYEEGTITRRVCVSGTLSYKNAFYYVGRAFRGFDIGLLATNEDGVHDVHFGWKKTRANRLGDSAGREGQNQKHQHLAHTMKSSAPSLKHAHGGQPPNPRGFTQGAKMRCEPEDRAPRDGALHLIFGMTSLGLLLSRALSCVRRQKVSLIHGIINRKTRILDLKPT